MPDANASKIICAQATGRGSANQRLSPGEMFAGNSSFARGSARRIAIVNVQHRLLFILTSRSNTIAACRLTAGLLTQ